MLRVVGQRWCVRLHEALSYVRARGRNNCQQCWELFLKVWSVSNFAQQLPTTRNNMQQGMHTDAKCDIQQFWELLPTMLRPFARASCVPWITSVAATILKTPNQCPWYVSIRILSQFNKCLLLFKSATFKMTKFDKNWCNSFRFCFRIWICQSRPGLSNESPNLHKKTMNLRILVVVVKLHHHAIVLLSVVQSFSRS